MNIRTKDEIIATLVASNGTEKETRKAQFEIACDIRDALLGIQSTSANAANAVYELQRIADQLSYVNSTIDNRGADTSMRLSNLHGVIEKFQNPAMVKMLYDVLVPPVLPQVKAKDKKREPIGAVLKRWWKWVSGWRLRVEHKKS